MSKMTYTVEEVAQLLNIGRNTAYQACREGQIPAVRIGRRLLVPGAWIRHKFGEAAGEQEVA